MKNLDRLLAALLIVTCCWSAAAGADEDRAERLRVALKQSSEGERRLDGATEWLNSPPLTAASVRGKVVLVDFWTYTCINWLRTLPYTRAWSQKYKDQGLVVIGVHTPEFGFEHDVDNVRRAAKAFNVTFPIAIDNAEAIWDGFDNHYWPALYLIDAKGRIRHHQFGEGGYEQAERVIQQLLAEAGSRSATPTFVTPEALGAEVAADFRNLRSPETYLGSARSERFASPGRGSADKTVAYALPSRLGLNDWGLAGEWRIEQQFAVLTKPNGRIAYRFHARDVHLVMGPSAGGATVRFRVLVDGRPPLDDHGGDVDPQGNGLVGEQRLYQLIRQRGPVADRLFEIQFLDPGVEAFAFTFG